MCLGELAEVIEVTDGATAVVRRDGRDSSVALLALEEPVRPGDWLLVHSGFALALLTPEEARDAATVRAEGLTRTSTIPGPNPHLDEEETTP